MKYNVKRGRLAAGILVFSACAVSLAASTHFESFESLNFNAIKGGPPNYSSQNWNSYDSAVNRVPSGTDGIVSRGGSYHAVVDSTGVPAGYTGAFTRLGGYSTNFRTGFRTSLDIYIDLNAPEVSANTYGWDLSTAVNQQVNSHRRDFIFHAASNASGEVLIGASNNSNFTRRNDLASINHMTITQSGWYKFEWTFRENGSGTLAVDMRVRDVYGNQLFLETRNDPSDVIANVVGGNRYMWFTFLEVNKLPIDDTSLDASSDNGLPIDLVGNYIGIQNDVALAATCDVALGGFPPGYGQVLEGFYAAPALVEATYTPYSDGLKPPLLQAVDMRGHSFEYDVELNDINNWVPNSYYFGDYFLVIADVQSAGNSDTGGVFYRDGNNFAYQSYGTWPPQTDTTGASKFHVQVNVNSNGAQSASLTTMNGSAPGTVYYFDQNDGTDQYNEPYYTPGAKSFAAGFSTYGNSAASARVTNFKTNAGDNYLYWNAADPYVKTNDNIAYDHGMEGLTQAVYGFQSFNSFSGNQSFTNGGYTAMPFGTYIIAPITTALDYAAGRNFGVLPAAVDALLGYANFNATAPGVAQVTIDAMNGSGIPTRFSDQYGNSVIAGRQNSNIVVIDDTAPFESIDSIEENLNNIIGGTAVQGNLAVRTTAYDAGPGGIGSGLADFPTITVQFAAGGPVPLTVYSTGPNEFSGYFTVDGSTPCGPATVTMVSTDDSGNSTVQVANFTVNNATVSFTLVLDGVNFTNANDSTRGMQIILGGTGGGNSPITINKNVTFGTGNMANVTLNAFDGVPCGANFTRMGVKDTKHTLRKTVVLTNGGNGQFTAPTVNLKGGDATDDNMIDILDYGVFASQYGSSPGASTPVGYSGPHADFSGNGMVGTEDYTFIGNQFLFIGDNAPGNYRPSPRPRSKATVKELLAAGAFKAAEFDLNGDGWVTFQEISDWLRKHR